MTDDRLFHRRRGHSQKVNALSAIEEIAWEMYVQVADDFGVMPFEALEVQRAHQRLKKLSAATVQKMLERINEVGLVGTFEHQERVYCYTEKWQDFQKVRYALRTIYPPIPAGFLAQCSRATQWLHTIWPGGKRDLKLKKWEPEDDWTPPDWTTEQGGAFRSGSGTVPAPVRSGSGPRARAGVARTASGSNPVSGSSPISIPGNELEPVPPVLVHPYVNTKAPALSRRPVDELLKSPEARDVQVSMVEGADIRPALCDRQGADPGGADDRRLRVEAPDQGPTAPAALRGAVDEQSDPAGHVCGASGAGAAMGSAAVDGGDAGTEDARGAAHAGGSTLAWPPTRSGRLCGPAEADDRTATEPAALTHLRTALRRAR